MTTVARRASGSPSSFGIVPNLNPAAGGIYQYSLLMLKALQNTRYQPRIVFTSTRDAPTPGWLDRSTQIAPLLPETWKVRLIRRLATGAGARTYEALRSKTARSRSITQDIDHINPRPQVSRYLEGLGVDFMLYPAPTPLAFETDLPFAIAIHDLHHRITPEFPEVGEEREWTRREYLFRNAARQATIIWSESEAGKRDILTFYGELLDTPDRVKVLPLIPAPSLSSAEPDKVENIIQGFGLSSGYLFYPAQFWPHKNHKRLILALGLLEERFGLRLHLVLTGGGDDELRRRTREEVIVTARSMSLENRVHLLGYVSEEQIAALYVGATALVMPTFFGPTNIPIVEAWSLRCPVVASRLSGADEQIGDAALLFDPYSEDALAEAIAAVATDAHLAEELVQRGTERLTRFSFESFAERLTGSLSWGTENVR